MEKIYELLKKFKRDELYKQTICFHSLFKALLLALVLLQIWAIKVLSLDRVLRVHRFKHLDIFCTILL